MEVQKMNTLELDDTVYQTTLTTKFNMRKKWEKDDPKKMTAFIPGTISELFVKQGQSVKKGEILLVLEAMKMKNNVKANDTFVVKKIYVKVGERVAKNQLIIEFE